MNKNEFISKLDYSLKGINYDDKREIIYDYEEHFTIGIEQGKSEEDIAAALGDPRMIAKQFRNGYLIEKAEKAKSPRNLASAIFASVGVGFLNLFLIPLIIAAACVVFSLLLSAAALVISILIAAGCVLLSLYLAALGFTLGGFGIILIELVGPYFPEIMSVDLNMGSAVFLSIGIICLGILCVVGSIKLSKVFYRWSKDCIIVSYNGGKKCVSGFYMWILKYLKMNVSIIKNKKENEYA